MQPAWKGQESTLDERPQAPEVPAEIQMPPRSYCLGSKSQPENGMTVYQAFFFSFHIFFSPLSFKLTMLTSEIWSMLEMWMLIPTVTGLPETQTARVRTIFKPSSLICNTRVA